MSWFCLALAAGACADAASTPETREQAQGGLAGELSVISILNGPEGAGSLRYYLRVAGEESERELVFARDPQLPAGTRLRVWGEPRGSMFYVSHHEVESETGGPGQSRQPLIGQPSRERTVAWVQMNVNNQGVNQTMDEAEALIFDQNPGPLFGSRPGDRSVAQYYDENSYGQLKLAGQVEGPIAFNGTACNNFDPLANQMRDAIEDMGRSYDHYYLYWGSQQDCGPGWGAQGTAATPRSYVWLNNDGTFCAALGQELGHNFGLMHASTMRCPNQAIMANQTSSCSSSEYGNRITVMGGGCRHLLAVEKWYSGFFGGCNAVRVRRTGTFTLHPIEVPCNGIQALPRCARRLPRSCD